MGPFSSASRKGDSMKRFLGGAKETEVTVRHKSGVIDSYRVNFDRNTEVELAI